MPVSNTDSEHSSHPPHATRRSRTECDDERPVPRFARVTCKIDLEAPPDCDVSVIFRRVDQNADGGDAYAFWLLVGRYGDAAMSAFYHCVEGDIRCDIPTGAAPMSSASLQPYLAEFLRSSGDSTNIEGAPPTLQP
jgi:hypothetical protein